MLKFAKSTRHLQLKSKPIENLSRQMCGHQVIMESQPLKIADSKSPHEAIESHQKSDNFLQT
jgi:hypothetical protein